MCLRVCACVCVPACVCLRVCAWVCVPACVCCLCIFQCFSTLICNTSMQVQSYPGYPNTFGQRGFIGCSDKRNCSDNPNETFLAIYILYNIKVCMKVAPEGLYNSHCTR